MRKLEKLSEPSILSNNKAAWLAAFLSDKTNKTNKYRYRHSDIKSKLTEETGFKCIYCESKIGHNTPGDIEHIIPSSKEDNLHFEWINLTVACTECNRRKNDYYEQNSEFLNPYTDTEIEIFVLHYGPVVTWQTGNKRAEIAIRILNLNDDKRSQLIFRKIQKIEEVNTTFERYNAEQNLILKKLLELQLYEMAEKKSEYSGMIRTLLKTKGMILPN